MSKLQCNKPVRNPTGSRKKSKVLACANGQKKTLQFGDPNMRIRKSNPAARKSFRTRMKCDTATNKLTPRFWACRSW